MTANHPVPTPPPSEPAPSLRPVEDLQALCDAATPEPWCFYLGDLWHGVTAEELNRADTLAREHAFSDEAEDIFERSGRLFLGDVERAEDAEFIAAARTALPSLLARLRAAEETLADSRDIYTLREAGIRVLDDEQCCELACSSGACESCPCCCAGWCVWGHSGEIPERDLTPQSDYRIWLDSAKDHNPVAKLLAQIEGAVDVDYDEPVLAALAEGASR